MREKNARRKKKGVGRDHREKIRVGKVLERGGLALVEGHMDDS